VLPTVPTDGSIPALAIDLRGELVSMVSLCAEPETQKASAGLTEEVLLYRVGCGDRI
jgi:site-specific DNA recombinase